ncbi:D-tyrosyl-tRNA(Tyr) deacylase [Sphaceloma murrayae]|uniref:D-tyrosyl-tRNA(Tyr) deacylase n=1 Tax=Sphaceloma murrayae TaxID=2082308 RepID=A0A2K1QNX8_9PEZI|nr:D-tyrosyl-tRNA(Tyr) deacylase [Sphaceloma murrayae]
MASTADNTPLTKPRPRRRRNMSISSPTFFSDMVVEDSLDAYLQELGPVQRLPTPPLAPRERKQSIYPVTLASPNELIYEDQKMLRDIARKLSIMNSHASGCAAVPIDTVVMYLEGAKLSLGCIALTYNILTNYRVSTPHHKRHDSAGPTMHISLGGELDRMPRPELVLLAAFKLASSFLDDHPTPVSWWTKTVTHNAYREHELLEMTSDMFASVGWKLPLFATPKAISSALASFSVKGLPITTVEMPVKLDVPPKPDVNDVDFLAIPGRRKSSLVDPVSPFTLVKRQSGYFGLTA